MIIEDITAFAPYYEGSESINLEQGTGCFQLKSILSFYI